MNILDTIIEEKRKWVAARKIAQSFETLSGNVFPSDRNFYCVLETRKREGVPAFILECKKSSPSQGVIRPDFSPTQIGAIYGRYADAVSVLCDEKFFAGNYKNIQHVRGKVSQPVLCKDFIVDPYQIFLARSYGADAILLMLSVLSDEEYTSFASIAHSLNMGVLTEADSAKSVTRANRLGARIIGINNRNLRTLKTDTARVQKLAASVRENAVCVSESGLQTHADAQKIAPTADAFLVGTSLMREPNLDRACRRLIFGENKVCGLTREADAQAAHAAGAVFGGLIFVKDSPRNINVKRAGEIISATPDLDFVGVFQDESADMISKIAAALNLAAVQLHGNEDATFVAELRKNLPAGTQIWKAVAVRKNVDLNVADFSNIDRLVFDTAHGKTFGGTGTTFDWNRVPAELKSHAMLAGGITPENAREAHRIGCLGLDLNSGVETNPGEKSTEKIRAVFSEVRKF